MAFRGILYDTMSVCRRNRAHLAWGGSCQFIFTTLDGSATAQLSYSNAYHDVDGTFTSYDFEAWSNATGIPFADFYTESPLAVPGSIGVNNPWVIADAGQPIPEPGTLTLLVSAMLGLAGAFYLRRRRAKA
jgi:hypothetical protein